ncbi:MAG: VTT domain-containing protein [Candidatus Micrarchaeia archaeon]
MPRIDNKALASLLLSLAITALALWLGPQLSQQQLAAWGYLGVFVMMLVSSATVILPVPGLAVVFVLGHYTNPLLLGIAAGLGSGLGELTGYLAGYGAEGLFRKKEGARYRALRDWMFKQNHGALALFFLALIPNPAFDLAGIVAGATRYTWWKFLAAVILGKTIRSIALAWLGSKLWF